MKMCALTRVRACQCRFLTHFARGEELPFKIFLFDTLVHAGLTNHGIGVRLPCIEKTSGRFIDTG